MCQRLLYLFFFTLCLLLLRLATTYLYIYIHYIYEYRFFFCLLAFIFICSTYYIEKENIHTHNNPSVVLLPTDLLCSGKLCITFVCARFYLFHHFCPDLDFAPFYFNSFFVFFSGFVFGLKIALVLVFIYILINLLLFSCSNFFFSL